MDFLAACEDLATNIAAFDLANENDIHVSDSDSRRWQNLFSFTQHEAVKEICDWRSDFSRSTISQAAWETVKENKMGEGYDKEAYEYSLFRARLVRKTTSSGVKNAVSGESTFLLKLEGNLPSVEAVEAMASLDKTPKVLPGLDDDGNQTRFCLLTGSSKTKLMDSLSRQNLAWQPTIIRVSMEAKSLSPVSRHPTLGIDTTLPQFRPGQSEACSSSPAQDQYPVWYFFYGTLADASILSRVLGLSDEDVPEYKRARVRRGRLSTWADKYLGLVDADEDSAVDGWAYLVKSQHEEEALRVYETGKYAVVRCRVELLDDEQFVQGLSFRMA